MKAESKVENILFDLDGTIIDSYPGIQSSFSYAYEKLYNKPCVYNIRSHVGPPLKEILTSISGETKSDRLDSFIGYFQEKYDSEHYKVCELYEGITELLKYLSGIGINLF